MRLIQRAAIVLSAVLAAYPAAAQNQPEPDRSDPAIAEQELERPEAQRPAQPRVAIETPAAATAASPDREIIAGAIRIRGADRVPVAAFSLEIEPFLGRPLGQSDLVRLATAVADVARRRGYGLATAWVPAQDLIGGVLTVDLDEGRIHGVRARGPGAALVEQRLALLADGSPVRTAALEERLLLAGDSAGLWVGEARLIREGNRNILTVATRHERARGRITIDNWGSETVGPVRAWAEVDVNGVIGRHDGLRLGIATTPVEPQTFQLVEGQYRLPLGERGTTIGIGGYYGRTDVERGPDTNGYQGDSWQIELEAVHPLARSRARSLWLTGRVSLRDSALERAGTMARDDRIVTGTASIYGYDRFAGGRVRVRAELVQGFDLLGATEAGDPLASRTDADGVFTKLETWAEYWRRLGGGFSTELTVRAQLADGPLLSSQEMGLGGPSFLRAFDYRELSGDEGVAASAELRFDLKDIARPIDNVQFYAYGDAGRVTNDGGRGRSGSLASVGGGIRVTLNRSWEAGVELGVPLTDGDYDDDPSARFSFSLRAKF